MVQKRLNSSKGGGGFFDIHSLIGKLPKPTACWTPGKYKYMGPMNDLDSQLDYNRNSGEITKYHVKPYHEIDRISSQHDVDYSICSDKKLGKACKNEADCKMMKAIDDLPYKNVPKWGQTARFLINAKHKLGMRVKSINMKSRRVKKTGKKN